KDSFYITILQDIWEGLESGQFSASQLRELSHSLQKKDPKTHFVKTIRWERANLILLNQEELESYNQGDRFIDESLILSRFFDCIGMSNTFWFRSRLNYSRFIQEHFLTANGKISWDWVDLDTVSKTKMDRMKF